MSQTEIAASTVKPLFPNHIDLEQIAKELHPAKSKPPCERTARNLMDRLRIPYVKVAGTRLYDRDVVRAALLRGEVNAAPRGRGRPRTRAA